VMCIGSECFRWNVETTNVLREDVIYKLYYTLADRSILSIERVG